MNPEWGRKNFFLTAGAFHPHSPCHFGLEIKFEFGKKLEKKKVFMTVQVVEVVKVAEGLDQNRACWVFSTSASIVIPRNLSRDFPPCLPLHRPSPNPQPP